MIVEKHRYVRFAPFAASPEACGSRQLQIPKDWAARQGIIVADAISARAPAKPVIKEDRRWAR
jgi:hypothetical protein